jgi:4-diphosphocytidyl-2-C-methyl-D-erythritol kinase
MTIRVGVRKPFRLLAPAKLNLGLEILGKRPDSYHEIVTILQTIDFGDEIVLEPATALDYRPPTEIEDDLTARALRLLAGHGVEIRARIRLSKRIPIAAGLGGGSSDAGTLLGALVHAGLPYSLARRIASDLGSDVPFFLGGGTALATDRGTELEPLSSPTGWFVIVVPPLSLRNKNAHALQFPHSGRLQRRYRDASSSRTSSASTTCWILISSATRSFVLC